LPLSDTERTIRTKRRLGCGFGLVILGVGLLLSVALLYLLVLRPNPETPLGPWIPPQADIAASALLDSSSRDAGGLIETAIRVVAPSAGRDEALDQALAAWRFFFYPRILVSARLDPQPPRLSWAAVANVKRADRLLVFILRRLFGDLIRWSGGRSADGRGRDFFVGLWGIRGTIWKTQILLSNDPNWLDQVLAARSGGASVSPLARALRSPAPIGLSAADVNGAFAKVLDRAAAAPSSPALAKAAAELRALLDRLGGTAAVDIQGWFSFPSARLVACPSGVKITDRAQVQAVGRELSPILKQLLGGDLAIETAPVETPDGVGLEIRLPEFGPWLAKHVQGTRGPGPGKPTPAARP